MIFLNPEHNSIKVIWWNLFHPYFMYTLLKNDKTIAFRHISKVYRIIVGIGNFRISVAIAEISMCKLGFEPA